MRILGAVYIEKRAQAARYATAYAPGARQPPRTGHSATTGKYSLLPGLSTTNL